MVLFEDDAQNIRDEAGIKRGTGNVYKPYLGSNTSKWDDFWQKQVTDPDDEHFVIEVEIDSAATKRF